jgi:ATP-dependent Lhr-like helicase
MAESKQDVLSLFHAPTREWFSAVFPAPTRPQRMGWPAIARNESTLILAPTGTGKTLTAFMACLDRLMFEPLPDVKHRCRVLYISPIKALAVDVERNLRAPLIGIAQAAQRTSVPYNEPSIFIRTGDTPAAERARFQRSPADILITTPESLYLMLTSNAREALRTVETVILDEIHALVPTKRGAHLMLSLERLEELCGRKLQRIGLSATQRPLEEVAQFLGGASENQEQIPRSARNDNAGAEGLATEEQIPRRSAPRNDNASGGNDAAIVDEAELAEAATEFRPVTIVDASEPKRLDLKIEVPLEDMARLDQIEEIPSGAASQRPKWYSIWAAIHPKLVEQVRAHRSTIIFVNSRRLAERISGAMNELAGETLVMAHHGSVAAPQRKEIEDRLKMGTLRGIVATSSLELGIDMGAVDLVIQVESPPSVASGMQRIGRASHQVGAVSKGTIYPKYRADLVACAAVTKAMHAGQVESVRYPRNPLDVLAQQIVATVALDPWKVDELFAMMRRAANYTTLSRVLFDAVLDMLSGRYPSDEFAELRPRITWDRVNQTLSARQGAKQIAIANGGTIPDRGLYGVFLAGATRGARVGELDEEMVFESRQGDTFTLGASTWRIEEITHDRVLVSPAPGEPGKMPFWHGDQAGRPAEFGENIGRMTRQLVHMPRPAAIELLIREHDLDQNAAENLIRYLEDQRAATERVPSEQDIVVERTRDEIGDWRICVLSPFGTRVHAPWCMAITQKLRDEQGLEAESMWSDDGFVLRLPDSEAPIESEALFPAVAELQTLVTRQLGSTALFAAKFREVAARALLLPRRRPGTRAPLWQQRKRASDLLAVAAQFESFPMLLETYRECMRDVFDLTACVRVLRRIESGEIKITTVESTKPSPFAAALLFSYVANYIYEGDAPLAERRAQALAIDQSQLQELLGDTDLRELLDAAVIDEVEARLQALDPEYQAKHADAIHDLLVRLGDLTHEEIQKRSAIEAAEPLRELEHARRIIHVQLAGERRYVAVEDAAKYRDAFGVPLPPGLPGVWLTPSANAIVDIARKYARTHGPFTTAEFTKRYAQAEKAADAALRHLLRAGKLLEGEFRPNGYGDEWVDAEVLRVIRRKTLAKLRHEVEPAEQQVYARFLTRWQGAARPRKGLDALLDVIELLQGAPLLLSDLERDILPARIADYKPADLDALMAAGEVLWTGVERVGDRDGRIALYLTESAGTLIPPTETASLLPQLSDKARQMLETLRTNGAQFFPALHAAIGGFPGETLDALWELVWAGLVTNDTLEPLRTLRRGNASAREIARRDGAQAGSPEFLRRFRSRLSSGPGTQGRWSLVTSRVAQQANVTEYATAAANQLLTRYGIVAREAAIADRVPGGYATVYPVLRAMEEAGHVRRGMFVAGLGAAQFAQPTAVDQLRTYRATSSEEAVYLAASDPANPYGTLLPWPRTESEDTQHGLARAAGAGVVLVRGALAAFVRRRNPALRVFLPEEEPERGETARLLAAKLAEIAIRWQSARGGLLIGEINGTPAREHFLAQSLKDSGFVDTALGFQMRRGTPVSISTVQPTDEDEEDDSAETA